MRRLLVLVALLLAAAPAAAAQAPTMHVIFQEGLSVRQMTDRVAVVRRIAMHKYHVTPALTGNAYAAAAASARPVFGDSSRIEGFLFPDTYAFDVRTTGANIVANQLARFRSEWRRVPVGSRDPYHVLIVASMVERETAVPAERKLVSAVIWNRLAKGMPLAIDATIRYGLGIQGTRPLTVTQLADPTPYNTRLHKGLPPTPIGNPGLASMTAAAKPAPVDYLYYVRMPHSVHHFFTDDAQVFCEKAKEYGYSC